MALATSVVTVLIYTMIPTIFAATTYPRSSVDIAETNQQLVLNAGPKFREIDFPPNHVEPEEQSISRAGRKLSEIDFSTDLQEESFSPISVPVIPGLARRNLNSRRNPVFNRSRKPYNTVPVRGSRQGSYKGTQHIADLENELVFPERTSSYRLRPRPVLPAGPFLDDNGFGR